MKPPQFAVWMFSQLGARPGDQLEDLFPGSGAIGEAWRRYAGVDKPAARAASRPTSTADVGERSDMSPVGRPSPGPYDLAAVCSEQALVCPINGARCESIACVDVSCTAADANVDVGRAA
jgi:hypothetical protein